MKWSSTLKIFFYLPLYSHTENNTYCKAVQKTRSFGMFHFFSKCFFNFHNRIKNKTKQKQQQQQQTRTLCLNISGWKLSTLFQSLLFWDWWIVGKKPQYSLKLGCGDNASCKADSCSSEDTEEQCSASLDTWWMRVLSTDWHKISSLQPISWGL